jgi:hypothetical protein
VHILKLVGSNAKKNKMTTDDVKVAFVEFALEGMKNLAIVPCCHRATTTDRIMMCNCGCGSVCYVCLHCEPQFVQTSRWIDFDKEKYVPSCGISGYRLS